MVIDVLHNLKMMCDLLPQKNKCVLKCQKNYFFLIQEVMLHFPFDTSHYLESYFYFWTEIKEAI